MIYSVRQISEQEAPASLPLIQLKYPEMTPAAWRRRFRELQSHGGGVAAVQCEKGYFYGILLYEPVEASGGERVLMISDVVALSLTGLENTRSLMLEWGDRRARELDCERIDLRLN